MLCRLDLGRSSAGVSLSAPLYGEFPTLNDVRWPAIKELPLEDRSWNFSDLQRSRSERQHLRHNGTSDIADADGISAN